MNHWRKWPCQEDFETQPVPLPKLPLRCLVLAFPGHGPETVNHVGVYLQVVPSAKVQQSFLEQLFSESQRGHL